MASLGLAMPKRPARSAAVMRAVATISSVVSAFGTSASAMWMVTGTVRRSGPASIITGVASTPLCARRQMRQIFGVAGKAEAGIVERLLGDRAGDDGRGVAGKAVGDGAVDGLDGAGGIGRVGLAGAVDEAGCQRHDRQGAGKERGAASRRRRLDDRPVAPIASARAAISAGSARR